MSKAFKPLSLHGSIGLRAVSLLLLARSALVVLLRRRAGGPLRPSWTLPFATATEFFKAQDRRVRRVAATGDVARCRAITDSLVFWRPALNQVRIENERRMPGHWFVAPREGPTVLYFHGGGYAFYPKMTDNIIAAVTLAVDGRTFVPHYPLAPEHPFPAQLKAAREAYEWLLATGIPPSSIVFAGDSAGGHLALMLTLTLNQLPKPAAVIAISPWTDPNGGGASAVSNREFDWMSAETGEQLARWAGPEFTSHASLIEWPDARDLAALPPTLVHAGEAEICRDMIEQFCTRARAAGAPVTYRAFADMNHNFHGFGEMMPQSREALAEIGAFVAEHCG